MAESENDPLNTLIDAPTLDDGSIPKSVGESDGYVDCSLYTDKRNPIPSLKTIGGKVRVFNEMQMNSTISGIILAFKSLCQTPKLIINENPDDPDREPSECCCCCRCAPMPMRRSAEHTCAQLRLRYAPR